MSTTPQRADRATPTSPRAPKRLAKPKAVAGEGGAPKPVRARRPSRTNAVSAPPAVPVAVPVDVLPDRAPSSRVAGVFDQLKAHPVASSLVSAATAWLAYEGARRNAPHAVYEASRDALHTAGESLSKAASFAREEAEEAATLAKRSYADAAVSLRRGVSTAGAGAKRTAARGRETVTELWDNHPLIVSFALLAAGVAIGVLIPASSVERAIAGEGSAKLLKKAKSAGGEALGRGKRLAASAVREGAAAATAEAERVGLSPERVARKVKRIAQRVNASIGGLVEEG